MTRRVITPLSVFFNKGELYLVRAIAPKDSPSRFDVGIGRFMETVKLHLQGYGFDEKIGRDYPIGDDDPGDLRISATTAPGG
jgi:hypothetical protein